MGHATALVNQVVTTKLNETIDAVILNPGDNGDPALMTEASNKFQHFLVKKLERSN